MVVDTAVQEVLDTTLPTLHRLVHGQGQSVNGLSRSKAGQRLTTANGPTQTDLG